MKQDKLNEWVEESTQLIYEISRKMDYLLSKMDDIEEEIDRQRVRAELEDITECQI